MTIKKLTFHNNPEEPSAEADLALEFTVGDRVVRWPARGYREHIVRSEGEPGDTPWYSPLK